MFDPKSQNFPGEAVAKLTLNLPLKVLGAEKGHRDSLRAHLCANGSPLTILWKPHEFRWVTGQADPPGVAGAHTELILTAWGQVFNDKVSVQCGGHWLLPDLRACIVQREERKNDGDRAHTDSFLMWCPGRLKSMGFLKGKVEADLIPLNLLGTWEAACYHSHLVKRGRKEMPLTRLIAMEKLQARGKMIYPQVCPRLCATSDVLGQRDNAGIAEWPADSSAKREIMQKRYGGGGKQIPGEAEEGDPCKVLAGDLWIWNLELLEINTNITKSNIQNIQKVNECALSFHCQETFIKRAW